MSDMFEKQTKILVDHISSVHEIICDKCGEVESYRDDIKIDQVADIFAEWGWTSTATGSIHCPNCSEEKE